MTMTTTTTQPVPARRLTAVVLPPSRAERLASLERKHELGQLIGFTLPALLETAADIAATTTLPAHKPANEQALRMYLRLASSRLPAKVSTAKARARHERMIRMPWTAAQAECREVAERKLAAARQRAYVASEQADQLVEQAVDVVDPLLAGITLGDLPGLLRLAADAA
ncbi:hypothetical protein AB0D97_12640 [Streptomyces roseus]|uniref:hypothetical protein n=1 Tax=Streptomyces roseus TaxID=66430 RepID=UPI0033DB12EC